MTDIDDMIKHLQGYQQADMDGVRVLASRQAIEKAAQVLREQQAEIEKLEDEVKILKQRLDEKWIAFND